MSCPVDCELTDWTGWSSCHPYCIGTQNRSRTVKISNDFGGAPCGNLADEKSCTNFCMDCQLSEWTEWSDCTKTCASGISFTARFCCYGFCSLSGAWGYQKKLGFRCDEDHQRSLDGASPQDAEALCSADPTCGGLYDKGCDNWVTICNKNFIMEAEEGSCIYQKQEIGQGEPCEGYISETMKCNEEKCPVDCVMSEWTAAWPDRQRHAARFGPPNLVDEASNKSHVLLGNTLYIYIYTLI
ncbi:unnamed protein product [Effrenium voratum]|nr:unnamed protein product [Effrenium voratum]